MRIKSISEIPPRATIRTDKVKTKNGKTYEYKYAYWKDDGKLKKVYIGKSVRDLEDRLEIKEVSGPKTSVAMIRKYRDIKNFSKADPVAQRYVQKIRDGKCSIEWANRMLRKRYSEIGARIRKDGKSTSDWNVVVSYLKPA